MSRILILAAIYGSIAIILVSLDGRAQETEEAGAVSGDASVAPIVGDEAALDEEVVIMLKDGTAVHGTVVDHLPSGYLVSSEGVTKTVPFSSVSKVVRVGSKEETPAVAAVPAVVVAQPQATPPPYPTSKPAGGSASKLPPDFPKRPRKPGAALVGIGWPFFGIGFLGGIAYLNISLWIDWNRFFYGIIGFGSGMIVGLVLAIVGHSLNKKAKKKWAKERKDLMQLNAAQRDGARVLLVSPMVFDNGAGMGLVASF